MTSHQNQPSALPTQKLRFRIEWRERVGSTMDEVRDALARGDDHGVVVAANAQTGGRGRYARKWFSEPGEDLLFSVGLRPSAKVLPQLSILAGLGVAQSVASLVPRRVTIKWPNDVRIRGRKIAGVLVESRIVGGQMEAVVGVGLNVNSDPARWPEIAETTTSLRCEVGASLDRANLLDSVLTEFNRLYDLLVVGESLIADWAKRLDTLGAQVALQRGDEVIRGVAEAVDETGRLGVRVASGEVLYFDAGEVTLQKTDVEALSSKVGAR